MDFGEKISIILKTNKLQLVTKEELAEFCGFHRDTIRKAIDRKSELKDKNLRTFQDKLGINPEWWESGNGSIYLENHTPDDKAGDNKEKAPTEEQVLKQLIEKNDRYSLVPTIILTQYEIQSKNEIANRQEVLQKALAFAEQTSATKDIVIQAKNDLIAELKKEIAELRAVQKPVMATQKA